MSQHFLPGNPPVALILRRSNRARRISLRVSGLDGRVTLTLPRGVQHSEALRFAEEKADWIRKHLSKQPEDVVIEPGAELPFEGHVRRITSGASKGVRLEPEQIIVGGPEASLPAKLRAWCKEQARERLLRASDHYSGQLGRTYSKFTLRDTRSRWGSCSAEGGLMYSWRLILAPPDVLDYVAAHEVAHLAEMNHSQAFWDLVGQLKPGFDTPRAWLRQNGSGLHRYRFDN